MRGPKGKFARQNQAKPLVLHKYLYKYLIILLLFYINYHIDYISSVLYNYFCYKSTAIVMFNADFIFCTIIIYTYIYLVYLMNAGKVFGRFPLFLRRILEFIFSYRIKYLFF